MSPQRVALVTGASSGIGAAAAHALAEADFLVYGSSRYPARITNPVVRPVQLDVTDERSMDAAVSTIEDRHGALAVLVNNAGRGMSATMEEVPMDGVRNLFETNVFGLVRMTQLVLPAMRQAGSGRIINVGSVGGIVVAPGVGPYHATKYAVEAVSDATRMEVAGFGIKVVLIEPTGVLTDFIDNQNSFPGTDPDGPYGPFARNHAAATDRLFARGESFVVIRPEKVAAKIVVAATRRRPKARYKVGASARMSWAARRLMSDRLWDKMMAAQFSVD